MLPLVTYGASFGAPDVACVAFPCAKIRPAIEGPNVPSYS